jgi:hypothetical protein
MKKIAVATLGLAIGLPALAIFSPAAGAAPTADTTATFTIPPGSLDIDMPGSVNLGTGPKGTTISGQMGAVTVTDTRASADASWEASVVTTDFTTGGATDDETVCACQVGYWSGPATGTTGDGTFTPGQLDGAESSPLDNSDPLTAFTHTGGTGNNTTVWNPTLDVNVPADNENGEYSGTVTHSVA